MPQRSCAERAVGNEMAGETPDFSGILNSLLQNPAALGALTGLLGNLRREGDGAPPPDKAREEGREGEAVETLAALPPPPPGPRPGGRRQERECLLTALTPYLSPPRRRALEGACKILEVLELFDRRK